MTETFFEAKAAEALQRRQQRMEKACFRCGAAPGQPCINLNGSIRKGLHQSRYERPTRPNSLLSRLARPVPPRNERLDEVIADAMSEIERLFRAQIRSLSERYESPIEELFAAASLLHREGARHLGVEMYHFGSDFNREKRASRWDSTDVFVQARVGAYRVDFLFDDLFKGRRRFIAVDLDGHEWHERTKHQAARDKKRDRALVAAGYRIMRFTGSEVYANPGECLQEVVDAILAAREESDG